MAESVCAQHGHVSAAEALASYRHAHALPLQVLRPEEAAGATAEEQPKEAARSGPAHSLPRRGAIRKGGGRCSAGCGPGRGRWLLPCTRGRRGGERAARHVDAGAHSVARRYPAVELVATEGVCLPCPAGKHVDGAVRSVDSIRCLRPTWSGTMIHANMWHAGAPRV